MIFYAPSVPGEPLSFLYSLILGVVLGIVWDVFRTMRVWRGGDAGQSKWSIKLRSYSRRHSPYFIFPFHNKEVRKRHIPHHFLWTFVEDLLFMMIAGISFLLFCFDINMGIVRWYLVLGVFAGFFLYYQTVGRIIIAWSALIGAAVRAILVFIYNYSLYYVVFLLTFLINYFRYFLFIVGRACYDRFTFAMLAAQTKKRLSIAYQCRLNEFRGINDGSKKKKETQSTPLYAFKR